MAEKIAAHTKTFEEAYSLVVGSGNDATAVVGIVAVAVAVALLDASGSLYERHRREERWIVCNHI